MVVIKTTQFKFANFKLKKSRQLNFFSNSLEFFNSISYPVAMNQKTEFDKIGVNAIKCLLNKGRWTFERDGALYDMAPAELTDFVLSPCIVGADRLIQTGCKIKQIDNFEKGFWVLFSEEYFPNADVKFNYLQPKYDGWIYQVEELNLKGLMPGQEAWICPYMVFYYKEPPRTLFLKLEGINDGI